MNLAAKENYNNAVNKLNQIFIDIFYQASALLTPANPELSTSIFSGSPLGVTPRVLPSIFSYENINPKVHLNLSEKVLIDASEFLNAVYEDMS